LVWLLTGVGLGVAILMLFQAWRADAIGSEESTFVPISPCRIMDLRPGSNVGPRSIPISEAETYVMQVTGSNGECTIPPDAVGAAMNVTAVNATAPSFLQVWPADEAQVTVSSLNYLPGQAPTPNKVDVKLSATGAVSLFNRFGTVDVIADVVGYYTNSGLSDLDSRMVAMEANVTAHAAKIAALEANDAAQDATIAALAADVATLQSSVATLQSDVGDLQSDVGDLATSVGSLESDVGDLETDVGTLQTDVGTLQSGVSALLTLTASMSLETVDGQPTLRFTGVNVQVVDGTGSTAGANSLGNLIVGYNENSSDVRTGSHNLVVGPNHSYSSYGGFVAGRDNTVNGSNATVAGGTGNTATNGDSAVLGGFDNEANGTASVIVGGRNNEATGEHSAVLGGELNDSAGLRTTVAGGFNNTANGRWSSILGGNSNSTASDAEDETVVGGDSFTCADVAGGNACGEGTIDASD
jgi:uncharacterized coiled-coil protein SlyX